MRSWSSRNLGVLWPLLIWAWGAAYALDRAMDNKGLNGWSLVMQLCFPIVVGLFGGFFYFYTYSIPLSLTNSWFGGKAKTPEIRKALVVGGIPKAFTLLGIMVLVWVFGRDYFENGELPDGYPMFTAVYYWAIMCALATMSVWSVFSTAHAFAVVQGYRSAWKAWFHLVVGFALYLVGLMIPMLLWIWLIR